MSDGQRSPADEGRIVVSGLTKQYRTVRAVDDLSFTVAPGRVTGPQRVNPTSSCLPYLP